MMKMDCYDKNEKRSLVTFGFLFGKGRQLDEQTFSSVLYFSEQIDEIFLVDFHDVCILFLHSIILSDDWWAFGYLYIGLHSASIEIDWLGRGAG